MAWSDAARAAALIVRRRKAGKPWRLWPKGKSPFSARNVAIKHRADLPSFAEERAKLTAGKTDDQIARRQKAATKRLAKRAKGPPHKYNVHQDMTTWRKK